MLVLREPQDFPQTDLSRPSTLAEARQAHRMHSEATNVRIGLGVQGEFGRATFHLAEMTVESLIFITTAVICHQMFQKAEGVSYLFQELARPNANRNIHFVNSPFLPWVGTSLLLLFFYSQKSYA